jgi:hypothetical protein
MNLSVAFTLRVAGQRLRRDVAIGSNDVVLACVLVLQLSGATAINRLLGAIEGNWGVF